MQNSLIESQQDHIDFTALQKIQYGVYVITTKSGGKCNGQIATTVFQITTQPVKIALCLSKDTYTHDLITKSKVLGISVLAQNTPMKFIGKFGFQSGRSCDKFKDVEFKTGPLGCPLVTTNSLAILEGEIIQTLDVDTHTLFVAKIKLSECIKNGEVLTYEYYHNVIKGKSPKNAPTYCL